MKSSCYGCTYFREEKCGGGTVRPYCNDLDCTIDPYDPECNYHEDYED